MTKNATNRVIYNQDTGDWMYAKNLVIVDVPSDILARDDEKLENWFCEQADINGPQVWHVFAAYDGETMLETVVARNEEEAMDLGRDLAAVHFRMQKELQAAKDGDDRESFDAELDGFRVDRILAGKNDT